MKRSIHPRRLLAIFLIVGLVIAPLALPANAGMTASMDMASVDSSSMDLSSMVMASTGMASISPDMPCCPDPSAPVDCDQCPLMAVCLVKTFQAPPSAAMVEILPVTVRMSLPPSDPKTDGLRHLPPPKPPRSPVLSA